MRALIITALFGLTALADQLLSRNFPHLIIPLNSYDPNTPVNTQTSFIIQKGIWTEFSFDVPSTAATYCRFGFTISLDPVRGAPWALWGTADPFLVNVAELPNDSINKDKDTWNKHPQPIGNVATLAVYKSGATNFTWQKPISCQKGQVAQFLLQPAQPDADGGLTWYELTDPLHGITYDMFLPGEE
ncbi:hypothetical protein N0V90_003870 [Kalmusia sp. IMI 367209]|nr:hypothetical protein N0V90_003870 [Kalmusia sp. IMI 367209]